MPVQPKVNIEGIRELRLLLKQVGGRDLQKELGKVHRSIGELVIRRLGGASSGVGEGRGADIRPSAATREVMLRVGGSHRDARSWQWGQTQRWPAGQAPSRPHLIGAAQAIQPQIEDRYLDGVDAVIRKAGLK
jgi:hypothetical protein